MFVGRALHTVDAKGRLSIPAHFRGGLAPEGEGTPMLTIQPQCLVLYPTGAWKEIEERLMSLSPFRPEARRLRRLWLGNAERAPLDRQGRILIPPFMRRKADLEPETEVSLVGAGRYIELWNSARDQEEWSEAMSQFDELSAAVARED